MSGAPNIFAGPDSVYRTLFDLAGDAIIVCSEDGRAIDCNQAAVDLFVCTREHLIGSSPVEWSPEFQPGGRRSDEMAGEVFARAGAGEKVRFEWENRRLDGVPVHVDVTVSLARIEDRLLFVVVSRDISGYRRLQRDLRFSEEKFSRAFHLNPDAMLIAEVETGRICEANNGFTTAFGYSAEESLGHTTREIGLWQSDAERDAAVALMKQQGFIRNMEVEHRCKDGRVLSVLASTSRLDIDGAAYWLVHLHDITERKDEESRRIQAEQDLRMALYQVEQKERSKSRFLAATSHDLRQPLYAAQLFADELASARLDRQKALTVSKVQQALASMSDQLRLLLDMSRLEDTDVQIRRQDIAVTALFSGMADTYGQIALNANVRLLFRPAAGVLHSDIALLSRLLGNLIDNAIKFSPRGTVLVCMRRHDGGRVIQVRDNGQGIADIQHGAIFDDFYQIGNSARDPTAGYGLGLSIVSRIARLLGLRIQVASEPGKGSVFSVFVPD